MDAKPKYSIRGICQYVLDRSSALYPPEQRSWGRAASAEVHVMPSLFATLRWTLGALWAALRAGLARLLSRPSDVFLGTDSFLRYSWRSLSPLILALSLSLFLVPQFRQALQTTTSMWIAGDSLPGLSARTFHRLQMNAEKENDAQTLAFLAMQSQDEQTSTRLAHQAIALDPSLTWILVDLPFRTLSSHLEQLQRWDPDNAVPYLLRADFLDFQAQVSGKKDQNTILAEMRAEKSEFRQLMKRAFAAPQYDSYLARRLELDRAVMRKHGLDAPMLLLAGLQTHRTPALIHVHFYVTWTMAEAREAAARNGDARALEDACRKAVRFGEKLETQSEFERLTGNQLQQLGDTELADILDRQGKTEEAETLDDTLGRLKHTLQRQLALDGALLDARMMPIYRANPFNPGVVIHVASLVFLLALVFLALTFFYLRLRTAKAETVCALPRMISYAPALLFSSALVLLLTYMPYARVFRMYMIDQEMAKTALAVPMNDPQLLSSLSNLQYPYNFLAASEVSLTVWIAFGVVLAAAIYSFWRMRVSPAKV